MAADFAGTSASAAAATGELEAVDEMFARGIECLRVGCSPVHRVFEIYEVLNPLFLNCPAILQSNNLEQAVQLFADVLQTRTRHFGGKLFRASESS